MLEVSGAQLFTVEVGDGPDVAVMLHGGPGASHDYLRPGLDAVADPGRRRLFYYDQRGSGRSPLDAGVAPASWQEHVADLDAVRVPLGGPPPPLVGYSWVAPLDRPSARCRRYLYPALRPRAVRRGARRAPAGATSLSRLTRDSARRARAAAHAATRSRARPR